MALLYLCFVKKEEENSLLPQEAPGVTVSEEVEPPDGAWVWVPPPPEGAWVWGALVAGFPWSCPSMKTRQLGTLDLPGVRPTMSTFRESPLWMSPSYGLFLMTYSDLSAFEDTMSAVQIYMYKKKYEYNEFRFYIFFAILLCYFWLFIVWIIENFS